MTGRVRRFYADLERRLDEHYRRVGVRYVYELYALDMAWAMFVFALASAGLALYLDGGMREFLIVLGVVAGALAVFGTAGLAVWARSARPVMRWLRGERSAELARPAWEAAVAAPVRAPLITCAVSLPAQVGLAVYSALLYDTAPSGMLVILAANMIVTIAAVCSVAAFCGQVAVRPVLREIVAHLPPDFEIPRSRFGLGGQLIGRLMLLGMTMTAVGGGVAVISDDPLGRLALAVTLAPAVLLIIGLVAFPAAAISLVGPVDDLISATRRVAAGDLTAKVEVTTADELGELSRSFNVMTTDLRRMTEDLRDSRARIVAASDDARRQVERDLHDGAQQELVLLNLKLGVLERAAAGEEKLAAMVAELRDDLTRALQQLRDLAHGIYPAALENDGLAAALTDAARRSGIPAQIETDGAGRYPRETEAAVYFCCLEALQNAAKHAGPGARATVRLSARADALEFEVADDGPGFEPSNGAYGGGLRNMSDRIGAIGGVLRVDSAPGAGTTVSGRVPV